MVEKSELTQEFVQSCKKKFGERLKCIVLFGSRARGTASEHSDWDFLVVAEGLPDRRIDRYRLFQPIKSEIYDKFEEHIQVEAYKPKEAKTVPPNPLLYGVLTGYEILYGKEYWNGIVDVLKPEIKKRKPVLSGRDKKWEIAELV